MGAIFFFFVPLLPPRAFLDGFAASYSSSAYEASSSSSSSLGSAAGVGGTDLFTSGATGVGGTGEGGAASAISSAAAAVGRAAGKGGKGGGGAPKRVPDVEEDEFFGEESEGEGAGNIAMSSCPVGGAGSPFRADGVVEVGGSVYVSG